MQIRSAAPEDLETILALYAAARRYMRETGNPNQWGTTSPPEALIREDIAQHRSYVVTDDADVIHGVFAFLPGEDPTYRVIEDGAWKNDLSYGTIHRLAGDGKTRGVFAACVAACRTMCPSLRADTHADNHTMQHLLEKYGFVRCGIIHLANGSPRIAYQYTK